MSNSRLSWAVEVFRFPAVAPSLQMLMVFSSHGDSSGIRLRMRDEEEVLPLFQKSGSCAYWCHEVIAFSVFKFSMVFPHNEVSGLLHILLVALQPCQISEALFFPLQV